MEITITNNSQNFLIITINGVEYCYSYTTLIAKRIDNTVYATKKIFNKTTSKHLDIFLKNNKDCEIIFQENITV